MNSGCMLKELEEQMSGLRASLAKPAEWQSLDIDYESPRVERVWQQRGDFRLCLHRIHPCESALIHPHPWPSAVTILRGKYKMNVARGASIVDPWIHKVSAMLVLGRGSSYEMIDDMGWHSVWPIDSPVLSVMVTGKPFEKSPYKHTVFGKGKNTKPLTEEAKLGLLEDIGHWL